MAAQEKSSTSLTIRSSYIAWLQLLLAGAVGVGSFLAYSESKYVSKELYDSEVSGIKEMLRDQSSKLDKIRDLIIQEKLGGK